AARTFAIKRKSSHMAKAAAMLVLVALVVAAMATGGAAQCNAGSLAVCTSPIISGTPPSKTCCNNLKSQRGCFCKFARNPAYSSYINSRNAGKTLTSCGIAVPKC
uniref:Bifunctional inhibitor/plant lipid transfer protein/seed storage helical domain-containing protein n=4 Tax=Triticinae TaxID=1648030 RepID=A0A452YJ88_AEGTS